MPRLLLLRHAKAESSGKGGGRDHDRALSKRGAREAAEIGRIIAPQAGALELVLCSTSLRTRETWEAVAPALHPEPEVRFLRAIYETDETYLQLLRSEGGEAQALLLIGHNPAVQETALVLAAPRGARAGDPGIPANFPTAAVAIFDFDGSWADLDRGAARLAAFHTPGAAERD